MNYLIDSSAWIEYLEGSNAGEKVNKILEGNENVYVIPEIISEVVSFIKRNKGNYSVAYEAIVKNSKIKEITPKIAKEAGLLHASMKEKGNSFPIIDSLIISAAKVIKAQVISKDHHFENFEEAELI